MSERSVQNTYNAIFALIDIQEVWRRTRPFHSLSERDREELISLLEKVRTSLDTIEEEML
ncbi:MAG TPA: hypothetical protein ENN11_01560 [Methanomicrobia archaeon]|nr:hypothetical protein [Methanomicrobia archaeon]